MIINNQMARSVERIGNAASSPKKSGQVIGQGQNFQSILNRQLEESTELKFSKHANQRLEQRDIVLTNDQLQRLQSGVDSARVKGIKESLMVMDNISLIVNVENSTVVTALDGDESREHVFTNIDGAVLL